MEMLDEETFQKVRRNLVGVSVLVIADKVGNLKFCTFDLLGNNFVIANQSVIPMLLGIAAAYCFLRYLTSFNSVSGWARLKQTYNDIMLKRLQNGLKKKYWKEGGVGVSSPEKGRRSWKFTLHFTGDERQGIEIGLGGLMMSRGIALAQMCLWDKIFLEYMFPFVIAAFAILELAGFHMVNTTDGLIVAAPCRDLANR